MVLFCKRKEELNIVLDSYVHLTACIILPNYTKTFNMSESYLVPKHNQLNYP